MKLNNNGFAITGILYSLLILFVLVMASLLSLLVAKKNRLDVLINDTTTNLESTYLRSEWRP